MADIHRVGQRRAWWAWWVFVLFLLVGAWLAPLEAHAGIPPSYSPWSYSTPGYANCGSSPVSTYTGNSPSAVASAVVAKWNSCDPDESYSVLSAILPADPNALSATVNYRLVAWDKQVYDRSFTVTRTRSCNGTAQFNAATGLCETPDDAMCATFKGYSEFMSMPGKAALGSQACTIVGCAGNWDGMLLYIQNKNTGAWETQGSFMYDGQSCSTEGIPHATETDVHHTDCKGGYTGTVNGIEKCIAYSPETNVMESVKPGTVTSTVTTSTPGTGSTTGTSTTTSSTTPKSESTTCSGGTCTTSTTERKINADGTTSTFVTTASETVGDYCKKNPEAFACKTTTQGKFGGTCTAGFSCDGDAAMCAAATALNKLNCSLVETLSDEKTAYDQAKAAGATATGIVTANVPISQASFDTTNALGVTAHCGMSRTVTVWHTTMTLPFDQVCDSLSKVGNILLAVGFLMCIRIVGRG